MDEQRLSDEEWAQTERLLLQSGMGRRSPAWAAVLYEARRRRRCRGWLGPLWRAAYALGLVSTPTKDRLLP